MFSISSRVRIALGGLVIASVYAKAVNLPANCARNTTVHLGETCDIISATFNVSTYQLAYVNNGTIDAACDNLAEGEPLCLGFADQDCIQTHVVISGDSCFAIALNANISGTVLSNNNPNVNAACSNIYPGEVLCIADRDVYTNITA
ncbi:carbohydrate-binding module family 50 protein [Athelia psychrophila]|uniref:Carbohydrate-binding module family 50 protein n=1 Tax=Athelia psychrophila TaxID=1759441 RepID=A0A166UNN4_9AGAM|nr:carbohydrate-binding module family 50 protein [Fibularhizoctonia sp. CBS 109695]